MTTHERVLEALGDANRRRLLDRLAEGPAPVARLAEAVPISRPAVSQHLKVLLDAGLVAYDPDGTRNVYRLDPAGLRALQAWLDGVWPTALDRFATHAHERQAAEETTR